jgi:hypothetical protein
MKNTIRWGFFLAGIAILFLIFFHYFAPPFWPFHPSIGWRPYYFGPRTFPWVSFLGVLIAFIIGFALYKFLFPLSGSQPKKEEKFCPFCGRDLQRSKSISEAHPEDLGKEKV